MKKGTILLFISCFSISLSAQVYNPDCLDKTFSFFTIFDGFYLESCNYAEFGSYEFTIDRGASSIKKEGVYREVWFRKKEVTSRVVSGLQVLQNHVNAIKAIGGDVVKESDGSVLRTTYNGKELWIYITASTYNKDMDNYGIYSIEVDVMKQEVTAQDIKGTIASTGKVALYGILFDTGKSEIKSASEKAIESVATYLNENPEINVYIVGHTDNTGDYAINQKLSKARSESVKNYLVTKYGISSARLSGDGAGPICPVTTNDTEEGREMNRRVEIVKK
jgi:outer membrane protein OmpA-like peptidoglycan-associated protein